MLDNPQEAEPHLVSQSAVEAQDIAETAVRLGQLGARSGNPLLKYSPCRIWW
jgi:hypothetical protein